MAVGRDIPIGAELRDGRVLVAGGAANRHVLRSAEIYDGRSNRWASRRPDASCTIRGAGPLAAERTRAGLWRLLVWHRPEQLRALPPLGCASDSGQSDHPAIRSISHLALSFGGNVLAMLLSLPIVLVSIVAAFVCSLAESWYRWASPSWSVRCPIRHAWDSRRSRESSPAVRPRISASNGRDSAAYWRVSLRAWLIAAAITITCVLNVAF